MSDKPTCDLYGGPRETYAASWDLPAGYGRWAKVGDVSGVGAVGNCDSDFPSRSSQPFFLTGGPVKLKWALSRPATPGGSGPYLFGSIEPVGSMSLWHTLMNPVLETDFCHTSSMTLSDGQQAGRYRLSGGRAELPVATGAVADALEVTGAYGASSAPDGPYRH